MSTLLVAPLRSEIRGLISGFTARGLATKERRVGRLKVFDFPDVQLRLAYGGHGKTQFGVQTQHLLENLIDIERVFCVGAAGALIERLEIGDIVLAISTVEHDYKERFSDPKPLPIFHSDPHLLAQIESAKHIDSTYSLQRGIVASGDEDIVRRERAIELHRATDAIAVAWEGAGGARACMFSNVPYIEIRGITDTANHEAATDFARTLPVAMDNVADLIVGWLQ